MYKALITGGTKGIGAAIAGHLRNSGFEVMVCARSEAADIQCDVTNLESIQAMHANIGPVDILVNNAGGVRTAPFLKMSEENWDWHFRLNVKSIYYCTQTFLPSMLEKKWGRIVNIASTAAKIGGPYLTAYVATKHAVLGFTKALAREIAESGVTVNAVCPSFVDTPMLRDSAEKISQKTGRSLESVVDSFRAHNPQKRFVTPEEVAQTVRFLIESPGINGQAISICGGETY